MPTIDGPHQDTPLVYNRDALVAPKGYKFKGDSKDIFGKCLVPGDEKEWFRLTDRSFNFIDRGIFNGKLRALVNQRLKFGSRPVTVVDLGCGPVARAAHELVAEYGSNNVQAHAFDLCKISDESNPFEKIEGVHFKAHDLAQGIPMEDGAADIIFSVQALPHMAMSRETRLFCQLPSPADPFSQGAVFYGLPTMPNAFPDYEKQMGIIREAIRILRPGGQGMLDEGLLCRLPVKHPILNNLAEKNRARCYAALQETGVDGSCHVMGGVTPYLHIDKL